MRRITLMVVGLAPAVAVAQPFPIIRIADTSTAIPGTSSHFALFNGPSINNGIVGFSGTSSLLLNPGAPAGVYRGSGGPLSIIADTLTPIPGGIGNFRNFAVLERWAPSLSGCDTALVGDGAVTRGLYVRTGAKLQRIVDSNMLPSNGGGTTYSAIGPPSLRDGQVVFLGYTVTQASIYSWRGGTLSVVADRSTPIPGRPGTFTDFGACNLNDGVIAFAAHGPGGYSGIFSTVSAGPITQLYDTSTVVPGGSGGTFVSLGEVSMDLGHVSFYGTGADQNGIYTDLPGFLTFAAHLGTPIPGRPGLHFTTFGRSDLSGDIVAFNADDGVYFWHDGLLLNVLNPGDLLDGRVVLGVAMGEQGFEGSTLALRVEFTNGSSGIYMATIPGPGVVVSLAAAGLFFARRRR
ncbi:MAG: hypothetical protein IT437_11520 [Phycisphaerales bacterium]|nr:hypothetical protein [Phycisphaerales bacterium]